MPTRTNSPNRSSWLELLSDFLTTTPSVPTTGVKLFTRVRARRLPAYVDATGLDSNLQPALFSNKVAYWVAQANSTAVSAVGMVMAASGSATALAAVVPSPSTSFLAGLVRQSVGTSAATNVSTVFGSTVDQWFLSSTPGLGGFHAVFRFGIPVINTGRYFIGLSNGSPTSPATLPNGSIGMVQLSDNSSQWFLHVKGTRTGALTTISLGTAFSGNSAGEAYELTLFAAPGQTASIQWSVRRLSDGTSVSGEVLSSAVESISANTLLRASFTAATFSTTAVQLHVQSLYVETDN